MAKRLGPGRPPFEITAKVLAKVERLGATGATQILAAMALGINDETFSRRKADSVEFVEAWQRGRAQWAEKLTGAITPVMDGLIRNAKKGSTAAQLGFLNRALGSKDAESEGQAKAQGPTGQEVREIIFRVTTDAKPSKRD